MRARGEKVVILQVKVSDYEVVGDALVRRSTGHEDSADFLSLFDAFGSDKQVHFTDIVCEWTPTRAGATNTRPYTEGIYLRKKNAYKKQMLWRIEDIEYDGNDYVFIYSTKDYKKWLKGPESRLTEYLDEQGFKNVVLIGGTDDLAMPDIVERTLEGASDRRIIVDPDKLTPLAEDVGTKSREWWAQERTRRPRSAACSRRI